MEPVPEPSLITNTNFSNMKSKAIIIFSLVLTAASAHALTPEQMTDRACMGLLGPVKSVTIVESRVDFDSGFAQAAPHDSTTITFSADSTIVPQYDTDGVVTVEYTDSTVTYITRYDTDGICYDDEATYLFDAKGRVIADTKSEWSTFESNSYSYIGDSLSPAIVSSEVVCGLTNVDTTSGYVYTEFDSHGNWIKAYRFTVIFHQDPAGECTYTHGEALTRIITYC